MKNKKEKMMNRIIIIIFFVGFMFSGYKSPADPRIQQIFVSPNIGVHQGYTTDGSYHYCIDTAIIWKKDANWNTVATNADPFSETQPQNHLGDSDYYNGKLYVPAETWIERYNFSNQAIYVFKASDLSRESINDISAQSHEVSAITVVPEHGNDGIIYITSYCNGSKIWKYDLIDFSYLGYISLDTPLTFIQGIAYKNGYFYLAQQNGELFSADVNGSVFFIFKETTKGIHEGIDYSHDLLSWLIDKGVADKSIHFLTID